MSLERLDERIALTVNATFVPSTGELVIFGDSLDNKIAVSRNAAGTLLVNDGAVQVVGGNPTAANTVRIKMFGQGGSDHLSLVETNGALPGANLFGEDGDDTLIGGSGSDQLVGGNGNDSIFGKGGFDTLFGGANDDVLTGGDADDQVFGEAGNDRMIWNPGDDTDLNEGGPDVDTVEVNGGGGAEVFTTTANGTRVRFDRINPAPFSIDIGTTEQLIVNMNGGDDSFSATGNLAALIAMTVDGGADNDLIQGGNGTDVLIGGDGDDFIDGNQGADQALMGTGNDKFQWDPGDGSDVVEGQEGMDEMLFNGSNIGEIIDMSANGARLRFTRNIGNVVMDVDDVETMTFNALGGADVIIISALSATDVRNINVNLAGAIAGASGDGVADQIVLTTTDVADAIDIVGGGDSYTVESNTLVVSVSKSEGSNDSMVVRAADGNDELDASTLPAGIVRLTLDGGHGRDRIFGSSGADTVQAGDGNDVVVGNRGDDVLFLGEGSDQTTWNAGDGNDVIEGQGGSDVINFNGSDAGENIDISANGARLRLFRDIANVTLDIDDVERLDVSAFGGSDIMRIGDLAGTDVASINLNLAAAQGSTVGDHQVDRVTVTGTQGDDSIRVAGGPVALAQLPAIPFEPVGGASTLRVPGGSASRAEKSEVANTTDVAAIVRVVAQQRAAAVDMVWGRVNLTSTEVAHDVLTIAALAGGDVVNAANLKAGVIAFTAEGGLGDDIMFGSQGDDLFNGGDGNDMTFMGAGNDTFVWNPGDDNDTIEGQSGVDQLRFNGSSVSEIFDVSANGGRIRMTRNVANIVMDMNDVEQVDLAAFGGADILTVGDLSGTDMSAINANLAGVLGGTAGDQQADQIVVFGTNGDDSIVARSTTQGTTAFMPWGAITAMAAEPTLDRMMINGMSGDDAIDASSVTAGQIQLTLDGGEDDDVLIGGGGDDMLLGGNGDDVLIGGPGLDILDGGSGSNVLIQ